MAYFLYRHVAKKDVKAQTQIDVNVRAGKIGQFSKLFSFHIVKIVVSI